MNRSGKTTEPDGYLDAVLTAYADTPETPLKPTAGDRRTAKGLFEKGVPLRTVQTALALGSLRRLSRPPDYPRLQPIRSLAYFLPVIDELLDSPVSEDYALYLRTKLKKLAGRKLTRPRPSTGGRPENYVFS
jgi:hypothetical protein